DTLGPVEVPGGVALRSQEKNNKKVTSGVWSGQTGFARAGVHRWIGTAAPLLTVEEAEEEEKRKESVGSSLVQRHLCKCLEVPELSGDSKPGSAQRGVVAASLH
ncbi:hypothetical protein C0J52_25183, partial [Blattella germanica]